MVRVTLSKNAFHVRGHAQFAEVGQDIVCAGVSAIAQTALLGLSGNLTAPVRVDGGDGWMRVVLPPLEQEDAGKAAVILDTMRRGLVALQQVYPAFVQVREVNG
jgi:uncharacterized protein YsxB (DUF464 family)